MMFDGAACVRGNLLVGCEPDVQIVVMDEGKEPPERIRKCHHQNEPPMGFSGRQGQYAGGRGHGISVVIALHYNKHRPEGFRRKGNKAAVPTCS
jgi:hypothetical protein